MCTDDSVRDPGSDPPKAVLLSTLEPRDGGWSTVA
jgi:hypothetical protein